MYARKLVHSLASSCYRKAFVAQRRLTLASTTTTTTTTAARTKTTGKRPWACACINRKFFATVTTEVQSLCFDDYMIRIRDCLSDGDLRRSHEAYRDWRLAARQNQDLLNRSPEDISRSLTTVREELFYAWIEASIHEDSMNTSALIEAASQAHEILEDVDERLSFHALSLPPKGDHDDIQDIEEFDALNRDNRQIFSMALQVLQAWERAASSFHKNKEARNDAFLQRMSRGMPQRAQFLLQQLESIASDKIRIECYEAVLMTWACSGEHLRGVQAEKIFQKIPMGKLTPMAFSAVIRAWAWSRDPRAAFTATGHLMKKLRYHSNDPDAGMEPSLEEYEIVFDAWIRARDKMAPAKAMSLWKLWQDSIENGTTRIKPSLSVYSSMLRTATNRPNQPDLGYKMVDVLLAQMKTELVFPDAACYESAMCIWKNCALHPDVPDDRQTCLRRVILLLEDLRGAYLRSNADGSISVRTNALNQVLECLRVSQHSQRAAQAESILKEMEESILNGQNHAAPNADSYRYVLDVYRTVESTDRIPLAKTVLLRCKDTLLRGDVDKFTRKGVTDVLNAFILVCATTPKPIPNQSGLSILREALYAVERFRSECLITPNQGTYAHLLQAARELVENTASSAKLIDQIFRLACQDGMVDSLLLTQLMEVASPEQYQRLVVAESEIVEDVKVTPESWSRHVLGGRVISADGRRVKPLTVDAQLAETKAMQEFKMRRLRDKRNRKLLQGGRLRASRASSRQ